MVRNKEIREALATSGVKQWELAEGLGLSGSWFSVRMRKEFSAKEKAKALQVIKDISAGREVDEWEKLREARVQAHLDRLSGKLQGDNIWMLLKKLQNHGMDKKCTNEKA